MKQKKKKKWKTSHTNALYQFLSISRFESRLLFRSILACRLWLLALRFLRPHLSCHEDPRSMRVPGDCTSRSTSGYRFPTNSRFLIHSPQAGRFLSHLTFLVLHCSHLDVSHNSAEAIKPVSYSAGNTYDPRGCGSYALSSSFSRTVFSVPAILLAPPCGLRCSEKLCVVPSFFFPGLTVRGNSHLHGELRRVGPSKTRVHLWYICV